MVGGEFEGSLQTFSLVLLLQENSPRANIPISIFANSLKWERPFDSTFCSKLASFNEKGKSANGIWYQGL